MSGTNEWGQMRPFQLGLDRALNRRFVYLVFDFDIMQKRPVYQALRRLRGFLDRRGAIVSIIYLRATVEDAFQHRCGEIYA